MDALLIEKMTLLYKITKQLYELNEIELKIVIKSAQKALELLDIEKARMADLEQTSRYSKG